MPQRKSRKKSLPPFFRLKTTPKMREMAKRLVILKGGAKEIDKAVVNVAGEPAESMGEIVFFAEESVKEADELIEMLEKTKMKMERYQRRLKRWR